MKITFYGAVRTVTGSMHHLEVNGRRVLLDGGLYQGRRKEAFERNRQLPFDPSRIDAVVLSHAHIDHCGNLPTLVRLGFRGPIWCTSATRDLVELLLQDAAHIQEKDIEYVNKKRRHQGKKLFEPLYTLADVQETVALLRPVHYRDVLDVSPGVRGTFLDAGHILGSASVFLEIEERNRHFSLGFSGDLGRKSLPILRDPHPLPPVDWLICESTYGNRVHPPPEDMDALLAGLVRETFARRGTVLIPAFSVGRTQNIVYAFHRLIHDGRLPEIPIFVDSPLSTNATEIFRKHPEYYDRETLDLLRSGEDVFGMDRVTYVTSVEESKRLNERTDPSVILSASGMCESGRILHHLKHRVGDSRNLILIVGYQADHTLGKKLVLRVPYVKIFGEEYPLRAQVAVLNGYSAHADRDELIEFIEPCAARARGIFLIHGSEDQSLALQQHLEARRMPPVHVPHFGESFAVDGVA